MVIVVETATKPPRCAHFWQGATCLAPATQHDIWIWKVVRACGVVTFWLGNVLRAKTACNFYFIFHLTTSLRTRRFCEPIFRPFGTTNHGKNTVKHDFPTFSRTCLFFLFALSLLSSSIFFSSPLWLFPPLSFHLSILSEVWFLNFLRSISMQQWVTQLGIDGNSE